MMGKMLFLKNTYLPDQQMFDVEKPFALGVGKLLPQDT